jgi:hypothetical protein
MDANTKPNVKFGEWIETAFTLYKNNLLVLVLASLIAVVLSGVTMGILAGPMLAGLFMITLDLHDKKEPKPEVGDLFKGFQCFLDSFLYLLVWGAITLTISFVLSLAPCIGQIASIAVSIVIGTFVMFGLPLIADRKMNFWDASMASINLVKLNLLPFIGLFIVAKVLGAIGLIVCGIGLIVTLPIALCVFTVAYRELFGKE